MNKHCLGIFVLLFFIFTSSGFGAKNDFEELLNSRQWKDMILKGTVYLETGMYDKALDYFKALALNYPYIPEAQYYLGYIYYKHNDMYNAKKIFQRSIRLDPGYVPSLYFLALTYHAEGNNEKALDYFNKVIVYDSSFQSAYFNRGVTYLELGQPLNAIREFAYAVYLEPTDKRSIEALLKTHTLMKDPGINEKDESTAQDGTSLITKRPPIVSGLKSVDDSEGTEKRGIRIYVFNPGRDEQSLVGREKDGYEVISKNGQTGYVEIEFTPPANLKGADMLFKVKGQKGSERLTGTIKDSLTKVCPGFTIKDIDTAWTQKKINIENLAYMYVDTDKILKIRLEISGTGKAGADSENSVWIKDITIQ